MKILNKLELISPNVKIGGENGYVVELPKESGCILTRAATESKISEAKTAAINEAKSYTDTAVTSVYRVKGSVASVEDLPIDAQIGDVYNISDDLGGHNYVKTESGWDKLGGTVDLEPYALKTQVEIDIGTAKIEAISAAKTETESQISALNISQYAKSADVYTKTDADSTFVKIGDATTGDVNANCVKAENLDVSGDATFSGCTTFSQIPNVNGNELATVSEIPTDYLPATKEGASGCQYYSVSGDVKFTGSVYGCICGYYTTGETDNLIGFAQSSANSYTDLCVAALCVADYAKKSEVSGCLTALEGCVDAVEAKIPTDYLPVTTCMEGESRHHFRVKVPENSESCLWVNGLHVSTGLFLDYSIETSLPGSPKYDDNLTNKKYVDDTVKAVEDKILTDFYTTSEADAKFEKSGCASWALDEAKKYTDDCVAALNIDDYAKESEVSACLSDISFKTSFLEGCVNNLENCVKSHINDVTANYLRVDGFDEGFYTIGCGLIIEKDLVVNGSITTNNEPVATESYVNSCISNALAGVFEYKGSKQTFVEVQAIESPEKGDVWNVFTEDAENGIKSGDNVVFDGTNWDVLAGTVNLSGYYDKSAVDACVKTATDAVSTLCSAVDTKLEGKADKATTYTKTEVDTVLEGYLPVSQDPVLGFKYDVSANDHLAFWNGESELIRLCGLGYAVFPEIPRTLCVDPTDENELTAKAYVDNLVSTSISSANANIVYDTDVTLGDGTFDSTNSQMTWDITPEGATKILSVIAIDGEGNVVHPSYKWLNNKLTVSIFASSENDNPGYTVTVSYKK